jgi:hypothetical protein
LFKQSASFIEGACGISFQKKSKRIRLREFYFTPQIGKDLDHRHLHHYRYLALNHHLRLLGIDQPHPIEELI